MGSAGLANDAASADDDGSAGDACFVVIEVLTGFRNFVTRFLSSKAPRLLARASKDAKV